MLFAHSIRKAAKRTFWTAGTSNPIRIAMMAITTNNSTKVKPHLFICLTQAHALNLMI
jgi:hypothetical protein